MPITSTVRRSEAEAISSACSMATGRLDHGPDLGVVGGPAGLERRLDGVHVGGRVHLGHDDGVGAGLGDRGDVVGVPLGVEAVDPDRQLLGAVLAATAAAAHDPVAGLGLGVGGDGVLEVEDEGVGGEALGLLERPLVGAGHVEHGAAGERSRLVAHVRASDPVVRARRPRPARGRVRHSGVGQVDHHLALLDRGVVLHLAVDHHRAGAVAHLLDDVRGPGDVRGVGREHLLGDVDLHRVQAPGADAAEQEGVAELVLAGRRCP